MHLASRGLTFAAVAALIASARNTWSVPNGADPTPYVDQAQPGDLLRVSAWQGPLRIDEGLVALAGPPAFGATLRVAPPGSCSRSSQASIGRPQVRRCAHRRSSAA